MRTIEEDLKEHLKMIAPWIPDWELDWLIPYTVKAAIGAGIIKEVDGYYVFTKKVKDPKCWDMVWELLELAGILQEGGEAS